MTNWEILKNRYNKKENIRTFNEYIDLIKKYGFHTYFESSKERQKEYYDYMELRNEKEKNLIEFIRPLLLEIKPNSLTDLSQFCQLLAKNGLENYLFENYIEDEPQSIEDYINKLIIGLINYSNDFYYKEINNEIYRRPEVDDYNQL